jgi:hypothetical protein
MGDDGEKSKEEGRSEGDISAENQQTTKYTTRHAALFGTFVQQAGEGGKS